MKAEIRELNISASDYIRLRKSVGWPVFSQRVVEKAINGSIYCVAALLSDKVIGMGRITGDGVITFYICDLIVLPAYQGKGIGTRMLENIMDHINTRAAGHGVVNLNSAKGKEAFYERFGFWKRPTEKYGYCMSLFVGENKK